MSSKFESEKYGGIEILRFAMAILVILLHLVAWVGPFPSDQLNIFVKKTGGMAVPVFWCLSGFIFYSVYGESLRKNKVSFRKFAVARFSRLYPLAITTLVVTLLLSEIYYKLNRSSFIYHRGDLYHFVLNMFMASHWGFQKFTTFNGPIWSVSAEILIYVLFYGVVRYLGPSTFVAILVVAVGKLTAHIEPNLTDYLSISTCVQVFFTGGLTYALYKLMVDRAKKYIWSIIGIVFGSLVSVAFLLPERFSFQMVPPLTVLLFQLASINMPEYMVKRAEVFGSVTYSSYLLHFPVIIFVVMVLDNCSISRSVLTTYVGTSTLLIIILVISRVVFTKFEQPVQVWIRKKLG